MARDDPKPPGTGNFKLRLRGDLEFYPQRCRARKVWVVKDPLTLKYFQFREEEYEILRWLDGRSTLEQIKDQFERRFTPQRMTVARLHSFVANLHRNSLVISDTAGQGEQLRTRAKLRRRDSWIASLSSPLAIRFRGIDPHGLLERLYPPLRWLFSRWCVAGCALLAVFALWLVLGRLEEFQSRLPELNALISPRNLIWLAVAMGMTKLLHEFGHALTCRHFGGRCHEMGIMLLVFTPCLYCNVTDAWKLSSRWQRVAITAAGIYVEVVLASICAVLWWYSQPGFFNTLCLNVMVVCSVGTVLLNGNPLLRYDGYYILSDVLEAPNLWQDSRACIRRLLTRFYWGFDPGNPVSVRSRSGLLLTYAVISMIYRCVVVASLIYLVYRILKPQGLLFLAQLITLLVVVGIVSVPLRSVWRTLSSPIQRRKVRPARVLFAGLSTLAVAAMFFLLPLPCRIKAPVTVHPADARRVYVSVPGTLTETISAGTQVQQGDLLAKLQDTDVERQLQQVRGQLLRQRSRVQSLETLRGRDSDVAAQLPAAKEILADLEQRAAQLRDDLAAMTLLAPVEGTVLSPPHVPDLPADEPRLRNWVGSPLETRNLGCTLDRRTLFCLIGHPEQFEAVLYIHQSDVRYVQVGQPVQLQLDTAPGRTLRGTISDVSRNNLQSVPSELASTRQLAGMGEPVAGPEAGSAPRPQEISYQAHVRLDSADAPLFAGATGRSRISVEYQPLSSRVYRFLTKTFKPVM